MPLKKKTRTSTAAGHGKTKTKRNFVFTDNAAVGPRAKPLVSALKENNRCLATALGKHLFLKALKALEGGNSYFTCECA